MAQAARPSSPKIPNPCAAFRPAPPLPARRPNATPWPARPKDAPCPTSNGDRGHSGQLKNAPDNVMHKPSGGTYSKPEARVKLIPAEEITFLRHGKNFGRIAGSDNLEKRHCRRSVTPPPSSRKVYLARPTPLTHKATMQLSQKVTIPLSHKAATPLTHKATAPLAQKPMSALTHKPRTPPTAEKRQIGSLKRPSPVFMAVQRGAQAILHTELYKKPYQPESTTRGPCVELPNDMDAVPSTKSHMRNERQTNQEASISCNMPSGPPLILHTEPRTKTYRPDACWKGKFEVTGELTHTCDELEAHFPLEIFIKVSEASKQMPEVLKLEALPLFHLLPRKFKMEPPDAQDIGLCFISSHQRPNENFDHLLENVSSHIGLRTDIGTTELLIFSSKLLTEDDQTKDGKLYFCGVFRKPLRKKQHQANNQDIGMNSDMTEGKYIGNRCEIGMKLDEAGVNKPKEIGKIFDMTTAGKQTEGAKCKKSGIKLGLTGEEETNRINKCLPMCKTPDANAVINAAPAVSFFTGSCSPDSAGSPCKSATRTPACGDPVLDSPSGFSVDVPPGFTRAHCRLRRGETAESHIDPVLDTLDVPPGFTSAHRGLHTNDAIPSPGSENGVSTIFSEKKPPIKFSLNITKPVQTDVPPGFAQLLKVKKEPGLPAFSKATEKITPTGKVNEKRIKHDKVDVEVDDGSEERQFPKIKRLSDILGFSSASSSNNASTSSRPRNCSEVCRSASKFQETGPPEKEKLCRKRGQPEPWEPSAAEAAKRLKVNGRMALSGHNQARGSGGKS